MSDAFPPPAAYRRVRKNVILTADENQQLTTWLQDTARQLGVLPRDVSANELFRILWLTMMRDPDLAAHVVDEFRARNGLPRRARPRGKPGARASTGRTAGTSSTSKGDQP